jgi:hypothetical protein
MPARDLQEEQGVRIAVKSLEAIKEDATEGFAKQVEVSLREALKLGGSLPVVVKDQRVLQLWHGKPQPLDRTCTLLDGLERLPVANVRIPMTEAIVPMVNFRCV